MAKTSSLIESLLLFAVKAAGILVRALPFRLACALAKMSGHMAYYFFPKKRGVVYVNLRTVFAGQKSPKELRVLARKAFAGMAQNFVEFLCAPSWKKAGFDKDVTYTGEENVRSAKAHGKGVIYLVVHSGNWEVANIKGEVLDGHFNVVANPHPRMPRLDKMLNDYRRTSGGRVITTGNATRDIIRALNRNEAIALMLDQGGREGVPVNFLGKTASMSTGAIRLALKYGTPICPVWITRTGLGKHHLTVFPQLSLPSGNSDADVVAGVQTAAKFFERLVLDYPDEYFWFYKIFKYSKVTSLLILDDGKTGHLRQSQATLDMFETALARRGRTIAVKTVTGGFYKSPDMAKLFYAYAFLAQYLRFLCREDMLELFLDPAVYRELLSYRADYIISCGSTTGSLNFFLSRSWLCKAVCILKPGLVSWTRFHLVLFPSHDRPKVSINTRFVMTKAALNLITPDYLKTQSQQLLSRYSHLKNNVRPKIGVMIGGNTKGVGFTENQARLLLRQLKEAAEHFNMDLLVTTSRRTPADVDEIVERELKNFDHCPLLIIANEKNIPEAVGGILGLSDIVVVSGESISMVSEAVCSGKRTIVYSLTGPYSADTSASKYDRFVLALNEERFLLACAIKDISTTIAGMMRNKFALRRLDDRAAVARVIEEIL